MTNNLGGHVAKSAHTSFCLKLSATYILLSDTKISNLQHRLRSIALKVNDVGRLEIAMDDALVMEMFYTASNLQGEVLKARLIEMVLGLLLAPFLQRYDIDY